jgi:DNA polymerase I-like protein with 3'-5' exonuclease and polymerase domains
MKKILVLDLETTVQRFDGKIDNSPFNPDNRCVSAHYCWLGEPVQTLAFHHNDKPNPDSPAPLREALKQADVIVAHNAKFDVMWLMEMGFEIPAEVYCTMIGEYVLAKGQREQLSLKATAERRDVTRKKSDLVDELFKSGIGFEAMPWDIVLEYAEADVVSCSEIYQAQQEDYAQPENQSMQSVVTLMNQMLLFLVEIERNGVKIDKVALGKIEAHFRERYDYCNKRLDEITEQVMGDKPYNLASGTDRSEIIYSRKLVNKERHIQMFNIGTNAAGKPLYPPRMNRKEFSDAYRSNTTVLHKTDVICCDYCDGRGLIQKYKSVTRQKLGKKYKVQGEPYKNLSKCPECKGVGAFYVPNGKVAGLKLNPSGPNDASFNGFKTDKHTIKLLIEQARRKRNDLAVEFLELMTEVSAVSTYLDSFIAGIETWTRPDGILHAQFNQCITATGRLSSTAPNLQNMPKRGFPVREAMVSRFKDGLIIESDFSGLEFVMAGELSGDPQIIKDVLEGKDLHKQTASIINECDTDQVSKDDRQNAKAHSFAPIYGATGGQYEGHIKNYYSRFFQIYKGLGMYHKKLTDGVLKNGHIQIFSGRQFFWPNEERRRNGRTKNYTQQVNYPVQSAATADIVPLSCIRAFRKFKEYNLRSKLVLTVHDSIVVDTHPAEEEQVKEVLQWAMEKVTDEAKERWNYEFVLPLKIETSRGKNWLDQDEYD